MKAYDVVVIGAGPAGCAAAYHAAKAGCRTLVLDRSPFPRAKTCGDGLSPRSIDAIARMGLRGLPDAASRGVRVFTDRDLSSRDSTVLTKAGYKVVSRYVLDELLLGQAIAAGAEHWTATATRIAASEDHRAAIAMGIAASEDGRAATATGLATSEDRRVATATRIAPRRRAEFFDVSVSRGASALLVRSRAVICATGQRGARALVPGYVVRPSTWAVAARTYVDLRDELLDLEVYMAAASPTGEALGYGWVFPACDGRANVGVGVLRRPGMRAPKPTRLVAEFIAALRKRRPGLGFVQSAPVDVAPIPLELCASVAEPALLLTGDAAGLAHPLTAEGISAALESGEDAARAVVAAQANAGPGAGEAEREPDAGEAERGPGAGKSARGAGGAEAERASSALDANAIFRNRLAYANPMSFTAAGRVQELHDCARLVAGRGIDALTEPTPTVGTALRRTLLRAKPRPTYLRAAAREELDPLADDVRAKILGAVSKLNPFLAELVRDATNDPRAPFGRHIALALRVWRETASAPDPRGAHSNPDGAFARCGTLPRPRGAHVSPNDSFDRRSTLPPSRLAALAVVEALDLIVRLHDDLADSAAHDGWGNRALSMTLIDVLNAYALREAYAQPRSICRLLSAVAEQTMAFAARAALDDAANARTLRLQSRLALYRCSAALGTRDVRCAQVPASAERLAKALATMSQARGGGQTHAVPAPATIDAAPAASAV